MDVLKLMSYANCIIDIKKRIAVAEINEQACKLAVELDRFNKMPYIEVKCKANHSIQLEHIIRDVVKSYGLMADLHYHKAKEKNQLIINYIIIK